MQFSNPWGFLALLGIPAILLIHFLQRRERPAVVTTLFLLESLNLQSRKGNRFRRLIASPPMWLQLLGVLLLTWLLVAPKFIASDRSQRIAIILDSSASMSAFQQDLPEAASELIDDIKLAGARGEFLVLEDDLNRAPIYRGDSVDELKAALSKWQPSGSSRSPESALRSARHALGEAAQLIYLSDHPQEALGYRAGLKTLGNPINNTGLSRAEFPDQSSWQALVNHFSDEASEREWWISFPDGSRTESAIITLPARGSALLSGPLAEGLDRFTLHLAGDPFTIDDAMPVVLPEPKTLRYDLDLKASHRDQVARILGSLPSLEANAESSDLTIANLREGETGFDIGGPAILFSSAPTLKKYLEGPITASGHPLVEGLNWEALAPKELAAPLQADGESAVLVWKGEVPLILLKGEAEQRKLIFNFDLEGSGFERQPAALILIHRFCQSLRKDLARYERINLECREAIRLPRLPAEAKLSAHFQSASGETWEQTLSPAEQATLSAPDQPGFFQVKLNDEILIDSAVHFADLREADFSDASSSYEAPADVEAETRQLLQADPNRALWALVLIATMIGSWALIR